MGIFKVYKIRYIQRFGKKLHVFLLHFFCFIPFITFSQHNPEISSLIASVDTFRNAYPAEKIYLHFDKPYYFAEDTIWFKAYVLDASSFAASEKSGICYLEMADVKNKLIKRMMLPVVGGISWGNIALADFDLSAGHYVIRVYTSLMRNFGEQLIFQKPIDIYKHPEIATAGMAKTDAKVFSTDSSNSSGDRLYDIDLQFMPEGGHLVNGIPSVIGFKAIGEDGRGVEVEGKIINSHGLEVAFFHSYHKGMGTVKFIPQQGETYTAELSAPAKSEKKYVLPSVEKSGTVLSVSRSSHGDSLYVSVKASPDIVGLNKRFFLVGHSRGVVYYAKEIHFTNNQSIGKLAQDIFPDGIACFTLLDQMYRPLNERPAFINRHDELCIEVKPDTLYHICQDSVSLQIAVRDKNGNPVQGSFSLSVTDDDQVRYDSRNRSSMASYLYLTSELKGNVEEPMYYFEKVGDSSSKMPVDSVSRALDNLLLTQGWVSYPWEMVFNPAKPAFEAEPEFMIKGKASNILKGIPHSRVLLFSKNPFMMRDTLTDEHGRFVFDHIPLRDTASFIVQSINKNGTTFFNNIEVDEFKPPVFTTYPFRNSTFIPGEKEINKESADTPEMRDMAGSSYGKMISGKGLGGDHVLAEVQVSGKKIVKGSKSLNGPGKADQVLNTADIETLGKLTLLELLKTKIDGFTVKNLYYYYINNNPLKLVIDGNYVDTFDTLFADETYNPNRDNLEYFLTEDILGVEVMTSPQNMAAYNKLFLSSEELQTIGGASGKEYAWVEITTRAGKGALTKRSTGVMLYKPMPFSLPKQFYRPKYLVKDTDGAAKDFRSTIHWEPSVVTGADGKASVSFYTADQTTDYSVSVEGSDMLGNVGSTMKSGLIHVKGK